MTTGPRFIAALLFAAALPHPAPAESAAGPNGSGPAPVAGKVLTIKLGSLAPDTSPWDLMIKQIGQDITRISNGQVKLNVFSGGVLGDEPNMVKMLRYGQLHAAGLSTVGLSLLDDGLMALHLPLMFENYAEMDWVRERMIPKLDADMEKKGFVMLCWTDGGWAHFFSKQPIRTIDELRKAKLFVWAGDPHSLELYTLARFRPVPLASTDMLPGLQTGLIDVFDTPPLAALLNQWFGVAKYMIDMNWGPLMAGVAVSKKTWVQIPEDQRAKIKIAAAAAAKTMSADIRRLGDEAVPAMVKRGLTVIKLDPAADAQWHKETEDFWKLMRGKMGPPEYMDEVMKLRNEYRARKARS